MAITCSKGHVNDDANRFCDQCGEPLKPATASAPAAEAAASAPVMTSGAAATNIACPVCGQENVPGTAFCDNCGAPLPPPQPVAAPDLAASADATAASSVPDAALGAPTDVATVTCSQCGAVNDAANRFCDNCGATLADQAGGAPTQPEPVAPLDQGASADVAAPADTAAPAETALPALSPAPTADTVSVVPVDQAETDTAAAAVDTSAAAVDTSVAAPAANGDVGAERQRLQEEIATQRKVVEQLEPLAAAMGAAAPAAIRQGLEEARSALAQAEQQLAALPPERPAADPVEVARLQEEIATQRKVVEQLEPLAAAMGAAAPAAIRQGLEEARSALAQAEQQLADLTGQPAHPLPSALDVATQRAEETQTSAPAPTSQPATTPEPTPAASAPVATPEPSIQPAPVVQPEPVVASRPGTDQLPPAAATPAAPSGPRLVSRDGKAIELPRTGGDLIIGREDPVSGIHPQIDLTPYGGEAGGVSRRHALLQEQGGQWLLTDLDSTNYTRVDGNRLAPNSPAPLHDGARVQFGRIDFEFRVA